jgi:hypothetical protein
MVTFNKFALRKNGNGQLFLDLEVNLVFAPEKTIMQMIFPASEEYQLQPGQPIIFSENSSFDNNGSDSHDPINL